MAALGDLFRLTIIGTHFGEPINNTLHYRISALGTGDPAQALATGWTASTIPGFLALTMSNDYLGVSRIVQGVKPVTIAESFSANPAAGTAGAGSVPSQVACVITRHTSVPGKGGRGRWFGPAIWTGHVTNGQLNGAGATAFLNLCGAMLTVLGSGAWTFTPVLYRRKFATSADIISFTANPIFKTRRSRGLGTRFHRRKKHLVGSI